MRYYHSVGRVPLAICFAYGFPRLYQFVYPIPVRSVSVRGRLFVSLGLFVFCFPVSFMVSLLFASYGVRWSFSRVLLPFLFMHCSMVICFFLFLGRSSDLLSCFLRFCFSSGFLHSLLSFWVPSTVGPTVSGLPGLEFLHLHPTRGEERPQHTVDSKPHIQS